MKKINFNTYLKNRKNRISFFGVSPTFDWRFILVVSILIIIFGAVYGGRLYINIMNESLFKATEEALPLDQTKKKQGEIDGVIKKIESRNFDETTEN